MIDSDSSSSKSSDESSDDAEDDGDENSEYDNEEEPTDSDEPASKRPRRRRKKRIWCWERADLEPSQELPEHPTLRASPGMEDCSRPPVDLFVRMLGRDNIELLTAETNKARAKQLQQVSNHRVRAVAPFITEGEMRQVVGILMYTSIVSLPSLHLFWNKSLNITAVSRVMTRDRFVQVLSLLSLSSDNDSEPSPDRLHQVREFLNNLRTHFKENVEPEGVMAVSEQIIPFKSNNTPLGLKVHMKNKPTKWGIKVKLIFCPNKFFTYLCCGAATFCVRFRL